jgi:hypothetical protein
MRLKRPRKRLTKAMVAATVSAVWSNPIDTPKRTMSPKMSARSRLVAEPCDGDNRLAPALVAQIVRIVGHWLRPAEEYRGLGEDEERGNGDGAHEIDVRNRVEREPARESRGRVAERVSGIAVRHLVGDDREDKNDE